MSEVVLHAYLSDRMRVFKNFGIEYHVVHAYHLYTESGLMTGFHVDGGRLMSSPLNFKRGFKFW